MCLLIIGKKIKINVFWSRQRYRQINNINKVRITGKGSKHHKFLFESLTFVGELIKKLSDKK